MAYTYPGIRLALVAATAADARDVLVEGESGFLSKSPPWFMPKFQPTKRKLTWANGSMATTYSADEPDRLRGPQHHAAIADELAAWRYPEAFDQLKFGLRLGQSKLVIATTPRPTKLIRSLFDDPEVAITVGTTFENKMNLSSGFLREMTNKYLGTRLGRQELEAAILSDTPGALWTADVIDACRVNTNVKVIVLPQMIRIVVAVDPAMKTRQTAKDVEAVNETGIVVVGLGEDGHMYVLEDATVSGSPSEWASAALDAYDRNRADGIVIETNNGGDMVQYTIQVESDKDGSRVRNPNFIEVTASRGKHTRAEPIAALYQQGRAHHVGVFSKLEDQMTTWVPGAESPDRMDALVWGGTVLMLEGNEDPIDMIQGHVSGVSLTPN